MCCPPLNFYGRPIIGSLLTGMPNYPVNAKRFIMALRTWAFSAGSEAHFAARQKTAANCSATARRDHFIALIVLRLVIHFHFTTELAIYDCVWDC